MKFEFAAGGIVYKKENGHIRILVSQHSQHHGWVFPKGLIGDKEHLKGEGKEKTAVREVKEETGIDAEIVEKLTPATFWYQWEGEKRKKTVFYYIMRYLGGNFEESDDEMEAIEWLPLDEVEQKLTYKSDKDVFQEALPRLKHLANS